MSVIKVGGSVRLGSRPLSGWQRLLVADDVVRPLFDLGVGGAVFEDVLPAAAAGATVEEARVAFARLRRHRAGPGHGRRRLRPLALRLAEIVPEAASAP